MRTAQHSAQQPVCNRRRSATNGGIAANDYRLPVLLPSAPCGNPYEATFRSTDVELIGAGTPGMTATAALLVIVTAEWKTICRPNV